MLVRIRNAGAVALESTTVPYSKLKFEIANVLLKEGVIKSFSVKGKKVRKHLEVEIAYRDDPSTTLGAGKVPRIEGTNRVSKFSRRVYVGAKDIRLIKQGTGFLVLSTPKGVMTGREARKLNVGGEALFTLW